MSAGAPRRAASVSGTRPATGGGLRTAARGVGLRRTAIAVALAGLGVAGYLTVVHYAGGTPACAISHGCATVQQSEYAELAGVPVALLGLVGYVAILTCLVLDGEQARTAAAFLSLAGAGFSAWLTYVEVAELQAVCSWCVASAVCMTLLAGLSAARLLQKEVSSSIR